MHEITVMDTEVLAALKATLIAWRRSFVFHTYCHKAETQPTISVSIRDSLERPRRMNRKFTERIPFIAGRLTFIPELTREAMRHAKNCPVSCKPPERYTGA